MNTNKAKIENLLDRYFASELDDESKTELESLLAESPEARERFWELASMESALEDWGESSNGVSFSFPTVSEEPKKSTWRRFGFSSLGWVAALVILTVIILQKEPATVATKAPAEKPAERAVAYLSKVSGVASERHLPLGKALAVGHEISIKEGILQIDFYSGARVTIKGPARFVPESDMRIAVHEGAVQVNVADSAKGFVLALPDGIMTDLGTSFDVVVQEAKPTLLQVTQGEVILSERSGSPADKNIVEGQSFELSEKGEPQSVAYQPIDLDSELSVLGDEAYTRQHALWEETCAKLAADPSVVVHFRLLAEEMNSRVIVNRASGENAPQTGTIISAQWTEGRWKGKPALAFHKRTDRVRVDVHGEYKQASIAAWVRIDDLPNRYNGLFYSEQGTEGETHWQFSPEGHSWFNVRPPWKESDWNFREANSEPVISSSDYGTWKLLSLTYDSETLEVIHYVDGNVVGRTAIDTSIPLRFKRATLGNFFDADPDLHANVDGLGESWSYRNWSGAIDEFLLFSRVLDEKEMKSLYKTTSP
jgi:hypothetical protein